MAALLLAARLAGDSGGGRGPHHECGRSVLKKAYERPGAALRLVRQQWAHLLEHFDEVFLQPRVLFDWPSMRNAAFVSFLIRTDTERMVEAAIRASEKAIHTSFEAGVGYEPRSMITCLAPSDQLVPLIAVVREHHRDREPPLVSVQDEKATFELFQKAFCRVDWRLFDPVDLTWSFDADAYVEQLKGLPKTAA